MTTTNTARPALAFRAVSDLADAFDTATLARSNETGSDWVIVGGESGPRHRPLDLGWVREIRDRCLQQDTTQFFFKLLCTKAKRTYAFGSGGVA